MTLVTSNGTAYVVLRNRKVAFPKHDPDQKCRGNYNPKLDWGMDVAAACGMLVDGNLSSNDYAVRGAGPEWREVYDYLTSL